MLKKFIKAHYGKVGTVGTLLTSYLLAWTMENVGMNGYSVMFCTLLGMVWAVFICMAFAAAVEESL